MSAPLLSRFTPSLASGEVIEKLFVQRADLAARMVELVRESSLTGAKHHQLVIGARGLGKTHLVALIHHRLGSLEELRDRLVISWLREEEWGVGSFLDLLLRMLRELAEPARVEALYELDAAAAENAAGALLKELVGERTLLLIVENLDELFAGLGDEGQKRLRAYIQENPFFSVLATAPGLFGGVSLQSSPFYGFFHVHHLEELSIEEAQALLSRLAALRGDEELAAFINTSHGQDRVRAVHHLAGGNHRLYVILSQALTRTSFDDLVGPVIEMVDDLTPYYQGRMAQLSPQQRKIVELITEARHPVQVKEIARRCYVAPQVVSAQLRVLNERGFVRAIPVGREAFYELKEPLMRLCAEVKRSRGEPVQLFVEILRLWYSRPELEERLGSSATGGLAGVVALCRRDRWDDSRAALEAVYRAVEEGVRKQYDLSDLLRRLIARIPDRAYWEPRVKGLVELCADHGTLVSLGVGLIRSAEQLVKPAVSHAAASSWLEVWREQAGSRPELATALRIVRAIVGHREGKGQRALLELTAEERSIVEPMLLQTDDAGH